MPDNKQQVTFVDLSDLLAAFNLTTAGSVEKLFSGPALFTACNALYGYADYVLMPDTLVLMYFVDHLTTLEQNAWSKDDVLKTFWGVVGNAGFVNMMG